MHRPRLGSVLLAAAVATAGLVVLFAAPASAVNGCGAPGGEFPIHPGAQSSWKIDCTTNAGTKVDNIAAADAPDGFWHRGAARTASITTSANSKTITYASGTITTADLRRPISGGCLAGGAFIQTAGATSGTVSKASGATGCGATTAVVEYTTSRVLTDASCTTAASNNLTSSSALFTATDVNKSVSGGPFAPNAKITAIGSATQATVSPAPTAICTAPDTITLGAATYSGTAQTWNTDPMSVDMTNSAANGQAFTCAAGGHALVETAAATNAGQAFSAAYAKLKVVIKGATTVATSVASANATTLTLVGTCPTGITATAGEVGIGQPGAIAPKPGNSFATLSAELNLNPVLVATQDDCNKNTFEGFQVIGQWNNPLNGAGTALGYSTTAVIGAPVVVSSGQVLFPTSVVSFAAYIAPKRTGTTLQGGQHFEYVFPTLPTTLAVCLSGGNPTNPVAISFGLNPTVLSVGAGVPTGSGNPADPAIRALGVATGAQTGHYVLKNGTTTVVTGALPTCTIPSATTAPAFTCGDG